MASERIRAILRQYKRDVEARQREHDAVEAERQAWRKESRKLLSGVVVPVLQSAAAQAREEGLVGDVQGPREDAASPSATLSIATGDGPHDGSGKLRFAPSTEKARVLTVDARLERSQAGAGPLRSIAADQLTSALVEERVATFLTMLLGISETPTD